MSDIGKRKMLKIPEKYLKVPFLQFHSNKNVPSFSCHQGRFQIFKYENLVQAQNCMSTSVELPR